MNKVNTLINLLKKNKSDFFTGVPDSVLKQLSASLQKINKTNIFEEKLVTYIFKDLTRISLLYSIFLIILNGDLSKNKNVITTYSKNITIDGNDLIPVQIDGDNFGSYKKIHLNQSNKKVNFLIK